MGGVQLERTDQLDYLFNRHPVAEYAGNQFGIIPVFFVELFGQPFNSSLISAFVFKLEVITKQKVKRSPVRLLLFFIQKNVLYLQYH